MFKGGRNIPFYTQLGSKHVCKFVLLPCHYSGQISSTHDKRLICKVIQLKKKFDSKAGNVAFGSISVTASYMKFFEFMELDNRGKAFAVWHYGTFLVERQDQSHKIKLYALDNFYVEVLYPLHSNLITEMRSFDQFTFLEPYLELIEIDELIAAD